MQNKEYDLFEILNNKSSVIIDVRSSAEFSAGNVKGSINIPVDQIVKSVEEIKSMSKPIVLCCASGARSGMAVEYLSGLGMDEVYNGGSWKNIEMQLIGK